MAATRSVGKPHPTPTPRAVPRDVVDPPTQRTGSAKPPDWFDAGQPAEALPEPVEAIVEPVEIEPGRSIESEARAAVGRPAPPVIDAAVRGVASAAIGLDAELVAEHFNYNMGTALVHIWTADDGGDPVTALESAIGHLQREVARRKRTANPRRTLKDLRDDRKAGGFDG